MPKINYKKLFRLQDSMLLILRQLDTPFYLTAGTALGRFYLKHRYSVDLDFFVNKDNNFTIYIEKIFKNIREHFQLDKETTFMREEFARFVIQDSGLELKVEFVNDVAYRYAVPISYKYGLIDNVRNILSNKICAIVSRDEAKDIFDILYISKRYSFNWYDIFMDAKEKSILNEIEITRRIESFPVEWFDNIDWITEKVEYDLITTELKRISEDFFLARDNSLGEYCMNIEKAKPLAEDI